MNDIFNNDNVKGYEVQRSVVFENNRGFALAHNPRAVSPYVTWQFTQEENGKRDYYWGHYCAKSETAVKDYELRIAEYHEQHKIPEVNAFKYYSTQRPVDIGTFPKTDNGPVRFVNFDKRESVEDGSFKAWGYLVYDAPLAAKQIYEYELRPAFDNFDYVIDKNKQAQSLKSIKEQLAEAEKMVERGESSATEKKPEHGDRE